MTHETRDPANGRFRAEQRFARSFDALDGIFAFVDRAFELLALDRAHLYEVRVAIEELFTNMVKYAPDGAPEVSVALAVAGDELTVTLTDFDVEPFDIRTSPAPPLQGPASERQPGGLGIHLVRQLMDGIGYHYEDRTSTTTLTKRLR